MIPWGLLGLEGTPRPCSTLSHICLFPVGLLSTQRGFPHSSQPEEEPLVVALGDILDVRRCADPSLPPGGAIWISLQSSPMVRSQVVHLAAEVLRLLAREHVCAFSIWWIAQVRVQSILYTLAWIGVRLASSMHMLCFDPTL
jgi:hypothetical protein